MCFFVLVVFLATPRGFYFCSNQSFQSDETCFGSRVFGVEDGQVQRNTLDLPRQLSYRVVKGPGVSKGRG